MDEGLALEPKVKKYQTRTLKKKEVEEKEEAERVEKNEIKCDCPKILLVDDNEWNVYVLNIQCENEGYMNNAFSYSGQDAID